MLETVRPRAVQLLQASTVNVMNGEEVSGEKLCPRCRHAWRCANECSHGRGLEEGSSAEGILTRA
eukprot:5828375-Pyramimonas_sp.AAC.1